MKEKSGTETAYVLNNVRKITFSKGSVTIHKKEKSLGVYTFSTLRHLSFNDYSTGVEQQTQSSSNLKVYPNPIVDILSIDLTGLENKTGCVISILSIDGKVLQEQKINNAEIVKFNLSHLSQGIYLCRYANATGIKTIKIIKQ